MRNSKATETWFQIRLLKCFLLKHNTVQARSYCMCICTSAIKCVWVRAREDKKEEVKKKKNSRENSRAHVCVCQKKRQLSIQLPGCLVLTRCFTLGWYGHGSKRSPLELLAHCCFLCFTREQGGTAVCDLWVSARSPNLSQGAAWVTASIRALNHDSVYADRLKDKLLRCNTQCSSKKQPLVVLLKQILSL